MVIDRPFLRSGKPESFGWCRRVKYDTDKLLCYERPDGNLYMHPVGTELLVAGWFMPKKPLPKKAKPDEKSS